MRVYISSTANPFANLAIEDYLYKTRTSEDEPQLLFYVNEPAVVFGRSQNPWMEADVAWCQSAGLHIVRRFSGGGTVVHDAGNLNYSFFVPRSEYKPDKYVGIIVEALQGLGVETAHIAGQHSIYAGANKISGSAFALNSKTAMLHGCILVNSDMQRLSRALHINPDYIFKTATVPSVRAPVQNITDIIPGLLLSDVCQAIMIAAQCNDLPEPPPPPLADTVMQYQSYTWLYERTPSFEFTCQEHKLVVSQGIITSPAPLQGTPFHDYILHL